MSTDPVQLDMDDEDGGENPPTNEEIRRTVRKGIEERLDELRNEHVYRDNASDDPTELNESIEDGRTLDELFSSDDEAGDELPDDE